jgi:hypothetical protein
MESEQLNGYVRPAVTIAFTGTFCYLSIIGTITPDVFVPTVTMVLIYWFKSRDEQKQGEQIIAQIKEAKKE